MDLKDKLNKSFNILKKKYDILTKIKTGDKLYYDNNEIKIIETSFYQSAFRWYNNHSRITFFDCFFKDITDYYNFRLNYINLKKDTLIKPLMLYHFIEEIETIDLFHIRLLNGLDKLKLTYKDDNFIINQIIHLIVLLN